MILYENSSYQTGYLPGKFSQQNTKSLIFSNVNAYLFTSNDENTRYSKGKQLAPKQNKIKIIENPNSLLPSKPYIFKTQHNNVKVTVVL